MKALRIVQLVALVLLALYLVAFNNLNPDPLSLPLLPMINPVPPVLIVAVVLVGGWLLGWLPPRIRLWRRNREVRGLNERLAELERQHGLDGFDQQRGPVIPDRFPVIPDRPAAETDEETETS